MGSVRWEGAGALHTRAHLHAHTRSLHQHLRVVRECKAQLRPQTSGLSKGKERREEKKEKEGTYGFIFSLSQTSRGGWVNKGGFGSLQAAWIHLHGAQLLKR